MALAVLAGGLPILAGPSMAGQRGGTPDAECPGPIETAVKVQSSTGTIALTFAARSSGRLTAARVVVQKGAADSGNYVLEIRPVDDAGVPTDAVLASTTVDDASADPEAFTTVAATFGPGAPVEDGERYALVVGRPGAEEVQVGARFMGGDPCPQSRLFASGTRTTPYSEAPNVDGVFATFVTPPRPPVASNDSYATTDRTLTVAADDGVLENDRDPDGDVLSARLVRGPGRGELALERDGSFTYTKPKKGFKRTTFVYEVSDGNGGTDRATVTIRGR